MTNLDTLDQTSNQTWKRDILKMGREIKITTSKMRTLKMKDEIYQKSFCLSKLNALDIKNAILPLVNHNNEHGHAAKIMAKILDAATACEHAGDDNVNLYFNLTINEWCNVFKLFYDLLSANMDPVPENLFWLYMTHYYLFCGVYINVRDRHRKAKIEAMVERAKAWIQ